MLAVTLAIVLRSVYSYSYSKETTAMVMLDTVPTAATATAPNAAPASPYSLLSEIGCQTLRAAVGGNETAPSDVNAADLLQQVAGQGDELRSLLEELAQDLAAGNVTAAQSRLTAVLAPVQRIDETHQRFRAAQREAHSSLAAVQAAGLAGDGPMDATHLRQLHATASAVAAAFDELAVCTQAWADLVEGEVGH